jgi:hypothetical protein
MPMAITPPLYARTASAHDFHVLSACMGGYSSCHSGCSRTRAATTHGEQPCTSSTRVQDHLARIHSPCAVCPLRRPSTHAPPVPTTFTCSAHAWEATARATPAAAAPGPPPRMVNSPVPLAPAFKTIWHASTALVQYAHGHYAAPLRTHRQCPRLSRAQRMHGRLQLVPLRLQPHQGRHHAW